MYRTESAASLRFGETVLSLKGPSRAPLRLDLTVSTQSRRLLDAANETN